MVDDDTAFSDSVGRYLRKAGYDVLQAITARDAWDVFERERPAVVVLDLRLPDADGLDALRAMRGHHGTVVVVTGFGDIEIAVRAMQLGAETFLRDRVWKQSPHDSNTSWKWGEPQCPWLQ